ncbi:hypothetical protein D9M68_165620 [compost metagenome]
MPSGTTMMTETGIDQLSYKAARLRKTTRIDNPYSRGACELDCCCSSEVPVHSKPIPGGSFLASRSIASIACPELLPGADWPWISMASTPL